MQPAGFRRCLVGLIHPSFWGAWTGCMVALAVLVVWIMIDAGFDSSRWWLLAYPPWRGDDWGANLRSHYGTRWILLILLGAA